MGEKMADISGARLFILKMRLGAALISAKKSLENQKISTQIG
ncbi:hypothetical protein [Hydrogenophaga sp.]|nr:hypothetical protein [Hydrogenophaga sp.]